MMSFYFNDLPLEIKESICLKLESDAFMMMFYHIIDFSTRKIERRLQQERRKQLKNQSSESNQSVLDVPLFFGAWTQEHTQALIRSWEKAYGDCSQEESRINQSCFFWK